LYSNDPLFLVEKFGVFHEDFMSSTGSVALIGIASLMLQYI